MSAELSCSTGLASEKVSGSRVTFIFLLITAFTSIISCSWLIYYTYYNDSIEISSSTFNTSLNSKKKSKTKIKNKKHKKKKRENDNIIENINSIDNLHSPINKSDVIDSTTLHITMNNNNDNKRNCGKYFGLYCFQCCRSFVCKNCCFPKTEIKNESELQSKSKLNKKNRIFYIFLIRNLATASLVVTIDTYVLRVFGINNKIFCFPIRLVEVYARNANALWAMTFPIFFIYYNSDNTIFENENKKIKYMRILSLVYWIFPIVPACIFEIFMVNFYNPALVMDTYYPSGTHLGLKCNFPATNQTSCIYGNEQEMINLMRIAESIYMLLPCTFSLITFVGLSYAIYMVYFSTKWLDSNKYAAPENIPSNEKFSQENPVLQIEKGRKNLQSSLILVMGYPFLSAIVVTVQLFVFLTPKVQNYPGYMILSTLLQTSQGTIEFLYFFITHYKIIKQKLNIPDINWEKWGIWRKIKKKERGSTFSEYDNDDNILL